MPNADTRIAFAEKYLKDPKGKRFTTKGRDWVRDFYRALEGFKAWPRNQERLCDDCAMRIGEILDHPDEVKKTQYLTHKKRKKCDGLEAEPILYIVFCADRRAGKTFNIAGFVLSKIFQDMHARILYIASGEDQSEKLVEDNFKGPVETNPLLMKRAQIRGHTITVPGKRSRFEFTTTSPKSVAGRALGYVIIDESKDVPAHVAAKLIPSIQDEQGIECIKCNFRIAGTDHKIKKCKQCGGKIRQWYGRAVMMSAADILQGDDELDWFADVVDELEQEPHPNWHLIRFDSNAEVNPDINVKAKSALRDVMGKVAGMKDYVDAATGNKFKKKGETYLARADVVECADRSLRNHESSTRHSLAILDTSRVSDLTHLMILADETPEIDPDAALWTYGVVERIDIWDPALQDELRAIDPAKVHQHLKRLIPSFPNLQELWIDNRGMLWAQKLLDKLKREESWGRKVRGTFLEGKSQTGDRDAGWNELERRALARLIRYPYNERLIKELSDARMKKFKGRWEIRESNNRRLHLELSENLAFLCFRAYAQSVKKPRVGLARLYQTNENDSISQRLERMRPITHGIKPDGSSF